MTTLGADHPVLWCKDYEGGRSFYTGLGHTRRRSPRQPPQAPRGRDQVGRRPVRPGLQRLRRDRARQLPAGQDLGAAEPERADRLRPAAGRAHHPDARASARSACTTPRTAPPTRSRTSRSSRRASTPTARTASTARPWTRTSRRTSGCTCTTRRRRSRTSSSRPARRARQDADGHAAPTRAPSLTARGIRTSATSSSRASSSSTDANGPRLDLTSEQQIMRVPINRGACCHVGGDIDFDKAQQPVAGHGRRHARGRRQLRRLRPVQRPDDERDSRPCASRARPAARSR